ncbi:hypothetical protein WR25_06790 [Diploscapter pachys]|uniref:Homeobox domain-containing protein n=1 Tax=Diploscapter pachys TaxID=2018661 RepID=A0A2A2KYD2_9BILA|nr:hypothetical protein WR25_06790 [Diploscapter pachys]
MEVKGKQLESSSFYHRFYESSFQTGNPAKNPMSILDFMNMLMQQQNPNASNVGLQSLQFPVQAAMTNQSRELSDQMDKIRHLDESSVAAVPRPECSQCGEICNSIGALSKHSEEAHKQPLQDEDVKKYGQIILNTAALIEEIKPTGFDSLDNGQNSPQSSRTSRDNSEPPEKMAKLDPSDSSKPDFSQLAMLQMMQAAGFPFLPPGAVSGSLPSFTGQIPPGMSDLFNPLLNSNLASSPQKRARTRITDDQLKVLRQYFDINNSPTEAQVKEMSIKAKLPEKVIKHWFRNTLFKERQRDKDSPYNFNNPPSVSIDLETYEKTGEAKVFQLDKDVEGKTIKSEPGSSTSSVISEKKLQPIQPESSSIGAGNNDISAVSSSATPSLPSVSTSTLAMPSIPSPAAAALGSSATQLNFQAILSQMQQAAAAAASISPNPFQFMDPTALMAGGLSQLAPSHGPSSSQPGRRANRTRFTDFQLRTLQQFFEKQAYPKDDDLEMLSKKTGCSPRVVTVWFQNARQKARKIYENQPNHESNDRFVKTPGCNFQCRRCSQVFQRYYELIQHQQKKCYKDDGIAQANDNKCVEESLSADEKAQLAAQQATSSLAATFASMTQESGKPADLLKLLGSPKSSTDVLLKMCESAGGSASAPGSSLPAALASLLPQGLLGNVSGSSLPSADKAESSSKSGFHKRCPFCGLLFKAKQTMIEHLQSKHAPQMTMMGLDVDSLPNADDVQMLFPPGFLSADGEMQKDLLGVLDLSSASAANGDGRESLSMSPYPMTSEGGDDMPVESPEDLLFAFASPTPSQMGAQLSKSPTSNKRYRTHLTPLQVHMMKCVFADYKTPSMTECEVLGKEIGLHKRVVQVWFQNARAKERKVRVSNGEEEPMFRAQILGTHCTFCGIDYGSRMSLQDHIFSKEHMKNVRAQLPTDSNANGTGLDENINKMAGNKLAALKSALKTASIPNMSLGNGFPFSLVNGMMPPGMPNMPFLSDFSLIGTSIDSLQIPEATKQLISSNIAAGLPNATFTQDGETVDSLKESLNEVDASDVTLTDKEVGWACTACSYVFQEEAKAREHQRLFGHQASEVFVLVQTHYDCLACQTSFGVQKDYVDHLCTATHLQAKLLAAGSSVSGEIKEERDEEGEVAGENGNNNDPIEHHIQPRQELIDTPISSE